MTESTSRHKISPDDHVDTSGDADTDARFDSPATLDRGIPDLDGLRRRSIVGWLVPLAIVMLALLGAVWTVHGVLVRHDDAARARRSALDAKGTHEKVFEDAPALADLASAASAPPVRSSPPAVARAVTPVDRMAPGRSYYDAPLLAIGARDSQMDEASEGGSVGTGALPARTSGQVQDVTPGAAGSVSQPLSSPLSQALTPTHTPKVTAAFIGNRSLLLAQGTKIDCEIGRAHV